jgi:hypothetical protein
VTVPVYRSSVDPAEYGASKHLIQGVYPGGQPEVPLVHHGGDELGCAEFSRESDQA